VLEIVAGREQEAGGLPVSLPAGMETIESHCQDAFDDYEPYVDSQGNVYRYGYGLRDWPGRLSDGKRNRIAASVSGAHREDVCLF
jgi:beta-glucosidase